MPYDTPVTFTKTNKYGNVLDGEEDAYTIQEFRFACESGAFVDYDGEGYPVKDGMADMKLWIKPSRLDLIPEDATHIIWYNK